MLMSFIVAVFLGFMLGVSVGVIVFALSQDQNIAGLVATATWMFSWIVMHVYGIVWLYDPVRDKFDARCNRRKSGLARFGR